MTLALAILIKQSFPFDRHTWSEPLFTLLLGLVAVHALLGPIAYRWALVSSGETASAPAVATSRTVS